MALGFHRSGGSAGPLVFANMKKNQCNSSAAGRGARGGQGGTSASFPKTKTMGCDQQEWVQSDGLSSLPLEHQPSLSPPTLCRFYFTSRNTKALFSVFPPVFLTGC